MKKEKAEEKKKEKKRDVSTRETESPRNPHYRRKSFNTIRNPIHPPPFMVASRSKGRTNDYFTWKQAGEDVTSTLSHRLKEDGAHRENNRAAPFVPALPLSCRFTPLALVETRQAAERTHPVDATKTSVHGLSNLLWLRHILYFRPRSKSSSRLSLNTREIRFARFPELRPRDLSKEEWIEGRGGAVVLGFFSPRLIIHRTWFLCIILEINFFFFLTKV